MAVGILPLQQSNLLLILRSHGVSLQAGSLGGLVNGDLGPGQGEKYLYCWSFLSYLVNRVRADVNVHPDFVLQHLAVVVDPLWFVATEIQHNIEFLRPLNDAEEVGALPDGVDVAVRGVLVSSTGRLVVSVTLDGLNMGP